MPTNELLAEIQYLISEIARLKGLVREMGEIVEVVERAEQYGNSEDNY